MRIAERISILIVCTGLVVMASYYSGACMGHELGVKEGQADYLFKANGIDLYHNGEKVN